jgi:hypothetical protein
VLPKYAEDRAPDDKGKEEVRTVLFSPRIARQVGRVPAAEEQAGAVARAHAINGELVKHWNSFYDEAGAIGRRYRRQDEVGTPFCVTLDFQTAEDGTVTRERDSMQQTRVPASELVAHRQPAVSGERASRTRYTSVVVAARERCPCASWTLLPLPPEAHARRGRSSKYQNRCRGAWVPRTVCGHFLA